MPIASLPSPRPDLADWTRAFLPDTTVDAVDDGVVVRHRWGATALRGLPGTVNRALVALTRGPVDATRLHHLVDADRRDEPAVVADLARLETVLDHLAPVVVHTVVDDGGVLAQLEPTSARAPGLRPVTPAPDAVVALDRFAYLRRRPGVDGLCVESARVLHRARIEPRLAPLLADLGTPRPSGTIAPAWTAALTLLIAAGLVTGGEDDDVRLATWSFHDLLFHARSRPGRFDEPVGGHFTHRHRLAPLPAVAPPRAGAVTPFAVPAFAAVVARDRSLTEVLESRTSVRTYDDRPVTVTQLGEFLYRAARARRVVPVRALADYDGGDRPYPTGGLAGDLELYLSVARCDGLAAGVYHYEADAHQLRTIGGPGTGDALLANARMASAGTIDPQVLVTITSRFARVAWKYEAFAYALTLKHVGVLFQTMYLVATAMGLAPCALGSGDADTAARTLGLDWLAESSVGELALGSRSAPVAWADDFVDLLGRQRAGRSGEPDSHHRRTPHTGRTHSPREEERR